MRLAYFKHEEEPQAKAIMTLTAVCKVLRERGVQVLGKTGATISISGINEAPASDAADPNAPKRGEVRTYRHSF